jgi:DNA-binding PadR family transcriptional regulator
MRNDWWNLNEDFFAPIAGFGFGRRSRFFESGEVRLAILSLLDEGPKHGYQLMKELQERSGGIYRASAGSVYPTLQMLEDEGLIESERQEGRRVYRLTPAGRQELERDPEAVNRIWERAERWEDWGQFMGPQVVALFGPLGALIKATMRAAAWTAGRPDREDQVRSVLQRAATDLDNLQKG